MAHLLSRNMIFSDLTNILRWYSCQWLWIFSDLGRSRSQDVRKRRSLLSLFSYSQSLNKICWVNNAVQFSEYQMPCNLESGHNIMALSESSYICSLPPKVQDSSEKLTLSARSSAFESHSFCPEFILFVTISYYDKWYGTTKTLAYVTAKCK